MKREKEGYDISERADNYLNNPEIRARGLGDLRPLNLVRDLSHLNYMTFVGLMIFRRSPHGLKPCPSSTELLGLGNQAAR